MGNSGTCSCPFCRDGDDETARSIAGRARGRYVAQRASGGENHVGESEARNVAEGVTHWMMDHVNAFASADRLATQVEHTARLLAFADRLAGVYGSAAMDADNPGEDPRSAVLDKTTRACVSVIDHMHKTLDAITGVAGLGIVLGGVEAEGADDSETCKRDALHKRVDRALVRASAEAMPMVNSVLAAMRQVEALLSHAMTRAVSDGLLDAADAADYVREREADMEREGAITAAGRIDVDVRAVSAEAARGVQ